jgi:hypothetical protein
MTQFPQLEPLNRSYDLGSHPIAAASFNNGDETRFLHGAYFAVGVPMSLQFPALNLTQTRQISDHFASHGTVRSFTIPAHLWRTHASTTDVVASGFVWRYSNPPEETPRSGGLFDVSVSLLSVG